MKIPRDLSGSDLIKVLCRHRVNQVGSHVILQTETPAHRRIPIPDHSPLRVGTLNAILAAIARVQGITKDDILAKLR